MHGCSPYMPFFKGLASPPYIVQNEVYIRAVHIAELRASWVSPQRAIG